MLSNHFSSAYGSKLNWLILGVLFVSGALVRHFMNIRFTQPKWIYGFVTTWVVGLATMFFLMVRTDSSTTTTSASVDPNAPKVSFTTVHTIINQRCVPCHATNPADPLGKAAPRDVNFESVDNIKRLASRIQARAVVSKTMPLGNKTGMTDDEREVLSQWIFQGANVE
jgi:uncharacterized membrane protein